MRIDYFKTRKPGHPYPKPGVEIQFYVEREDLHEKEPFELEDGSTEERIVDYAYEQYKLAWRPEFSQGAVYDDQGNLVTESYINANYETLLAEAMAG